MWIFAKALFSGALGFLRKIPWQVWVALAAAFVLWRVYDYHVDAVAQAYKDGDKAGYSRAMDEVRTRSEEIRVKAEAAKRKADEISAKITEEVRNARDEAASDLRRRGDALRMHWKSQAGGDAARRSANLPGVPGGAVAAPASPVDDGLVRVDRGRLIDFAESHDQCQLDLRTWEKWHDLQAEARRKWEIEHGTSSASTSIPVNGSTPGE